YDVAVDPTKARKVLLTSGKMYWDLYAERQQRGLDDVALVRLEQYYPIPKDKLRAALERYTGAGEVRWLQQEPQNQGGWPFLGLRLPRQLPALLSGLDVGSGGPTAAPSAGSAQVRGGEQGGIGDKGCE